MSSLFSGFLRQDELGLDDPTALTILAAEGLFCSFCHVFCVRAEMGELTCGGAILAAVMGSELDRSGWSSLN